MGFIFSGAFWGVFLILIGISVLIKVFLNVDLPVFRIFFGLFFVAIGLNILFNRGVSYQDPGNVMFGQGEFTNIEDRGEYNVIFGKATTDLSNLKKDEARKIEINTIFGESVVLIKKGLPVIVKASSAFGQIDFPDGNNAVFGTYNYVSPEYKKDKPHIKINMNTVFGSTRVRFKD